MSSGSRPTNAFITPKEYGENQAKIAAARMYLESLTTQNEAGLRRFEELEAQKLELQRKIEQGEEAKRVMDHLQNLHSNMTRGLLEGPRHEPYQGTARIEEVPLEDSVHNSTTLHLQHAQRNPHSSSSQHNRPNGSVPVIHGAQTGNTPTRSFIGQQAVYPPPTVVIPETSLNQAAAFATQNRHSTHHQPYHQPQESDTANLYTNLYTNEQLAQHVPKVNATPPISHQPRQWGPSPMNQPHLPHGNTGPTVNPGYLPQRPGEPLEFVWDKDNSTDVRFLNIPLSDISLLKSKVSEFTLTAPLQTKSVIHPAMAVWKDANSVVWLYIRVEGGFWRYRNIDKFFEGQATLAKLPMGQPYQSMMMGHIPSGTEMTVRGIQQSNRLPSARPTPVITVGKGTSSSSEPPSNHVVTGTMSQQTLASGSNATSVFRPPTDKVAPVSISRGSQSRVFKAAGPNKSTNSTLSASIAATSAKPAGPQPPLDKKNLSKHILFALGKRSRDGLQRSPEAGRPTKKPSLGTSAKSQAHQPTTPVSAAQNASALSTEGLNTIQSTRFLGNISSAPNAAPSTSTKDGVFATQNLPMEVITTPPQTASGDKSASVSDFNDKQSPILPLIAPTGATSSPNATSAPSAPAPSPPNLVTNLVTHPISPNDEQVLRASQHISAVTAKAAPLPPLYRPYSVGGPQANQSSSLLPVAPTTPSLTTVRQFEPSQASLADISKERQPASVATNVSTPLQDHHHLNQQLLPPGKEPASSVVLEQNAQQNAHAGPSNVGTLQESPVPSVRPSAIPHVQSGFAESTAGGKRWNRAYVLVPPRPPYLVEHKRRLAEKRAAHLLGEEGAKSAALAWEKEPGDTYDDPLVIGEDYSFGHNSPIDASERESLRLSATRIGAYPCRWDRCDVVLNCADSLLKHLNQHPPEPSPNNRSYTCRWTQCGRRCTYQEKHLENHAFLPLRCAYKNCSETFRTAAQLTKHFRSKHKNHTLKPTAELRQPELERLPDVPSIVPGYLFVTKLVQRVAISKNRHDLLVHNVATNIVDSDPEKPVRLRARKAMRSTGGRVFPADTARDEYDFMTARSIRHSSHLSQPVDLPFSDLDSTNISELLDEGLMLWTQDGDLDNDDGDDGGDDVMFDRGEIKIEDGLQPGLEGPNAVSSISDRGDIEQKVDEEEVVANMLTQTSG